MYNERFAPRVGWPTVLGLVALAVSLPALGQINHTFVTVAPPGATETQAWGVNNAGTVVGYFDSSAGRQGFLLKNGIYTAIAVPGATQTLAAGINDAEQIVGTFHDSSGKRHGFLLSGGIFTFIDYPGASNTQARGISNGGAIVGNYEGGGTSHGFSLVAGAYTSIDVPGSNYAQAIGINSAGTISGFHYDSSTVPVIVKGFRLENGVFTNISFPGAIETYAHGINDAGVVAGHLGGGIGFLEQQGGGFTTFQVPGAAETSGANISNANHIVGASWSPGQPLVGFLATPGMTYQVCLLYDPTKPKKSGSTIPIKLRLCGSGGTNLSAQAITVQAVSITKMSGTTTSDVPDAGQSNPDQNFRYDAELAGYIFNLQTTGLSSGSYTVDFKAGTDTTLYQAPFQIK